VADLCRNFETYDSGIRANTLSDRDRRLWREHLWGCADCRRESAAAEELRRFAAGAPAPGLSPDFALRVARALRREEPVPALTPRSRAWLRAYWVLVALISAYIVYRTPLPSGWGGPLSTWAILVAAGVVAAASLIPGSALRRTLALLEPEMPRR